MPREHTRSILTTGYLILYNAAALSGWSFMLYLIIAHLAHGGALAGVWGVVERPLKLVLTSALLEVAHCMLGLVRAPVATTALQGA